MCNRLQSSCIYGILVALLFTLTFTGCTENSVANEGWIDVRGDKTESLPIVLFYEDVCTSCETETSFREQLEYETRAINSEDYQFESFDAFRAPSDWKESILDRWKEISDIPIPSVRIGNRWLLGEAEINDKLRLTIYQELGLETTEFSYYLHRLCPDCIDIKYNYEAWLDRHPEYFVTEYDAEIDGNWDKVRARLEELEVPDDQWEVPFFVNENTLEYWTIDNTADLLGG